MTEETIYIEGITLKIFRHSDTEVQQLNESKNKGRYLVGTYTFDIHQPHNPKGEYHIHLHDKGTEILSMNKVSGTAQNSYHGVRIPNKAFKALKAQLPDWKWPNNQIIESLQHTYILDKNAKDYLRPVSVFKHKNSALKDVDSFMGFFHQFAEDPFLSGGNGGWKEKTIALIETEDGYIRKVPVDSFRFTDV
jgi:hypothetical protein